MNSNLKMVFLVLFIKTKHVRVELLLADDFD